MKSQPEAPNKLVVIVGPTASGKTALAVDIAKRHHGEVISADSRAIYRWFDIGTAKPTKQEQAGVKHHLIDICDPGETFSAAQFKKLATKTIEEIRGRGHLPIIAGGTGLYVDAFLFDYSFRSKNDSIIDFSKCSTEELQEKVQQQFGDAVIETELKNRQRLEKILQLGPTNSGDRITLDIDCIVIGLLPEMPLLKQKIELRVKSMLNNGFIQEVKNIMKTYGSDCPQLNIIGYRHAREYIQGIITEEEFIERFVRDDYQLARRQRTWFRRNSAIVWCDTPKSALLRVEEYLSQKR